ncbi:MAG TPA: hypothetical protein VJQ82_14605 [Terriglobales bacterium]|nr:hypothetical protein [Terriglobales bacterium]
MGATEEDPVYRARIALGMVFLGPHGQGVFADQILWGPWLLPFGVLLGAALWIRSQMPPCTAALSPTARTHGIEGGGAAG